MNKSQINKLRMFESVALVLGNHSALFAALQDLVNGLQRLQEGIRLIARYRQVQEINHSGLTETKIDLRQTLIARMLNLSAALVSYANLHGNKELKSKAGYSKSTLVLTADPVLNDIGTLLIGLATPLVAELGRYFITAEKLDELTSLLTDFNASIPQKRVASNLSKVSTQNIEDVFKSVSKMLKEEMDVLMLLFEAENPDFYNAYRNARKIVDYGVRSRTAAETTVAVAAEESAR
jgi:hypothetical protein